MPRLLFECDPVGVFDARPEKLALEMFPMNRLADALPFVNGVLDALVKAGIIMLGVHDGVPHGVLIDNEVFLVPGPTRNQAKLLEVRRAICLQSFQSDTAAYTPAQQTSETQPAFDGSLEPPFELSGIEDESPPEVNAKPKTLEDLRDLVIEQCQVDVPAGRIQAWLDACGGIEPRVAMIMLETSPLTPGGDPAKQFMDAVGGNES